MSDYKYCPLMRGNYDDILVFRNVEIDEESLKTLQDNKNVALKVSDGGSSSVESLTGCCKESMCAWWNNLYECCAVKAISVKLLK